MKCEQPLDEIAVQVWLLYHQTNLNIALNVGGKELCTNGQTNGQSKH